MGLICDELLIDGFYKFAVSELIPGVGLDVVAVYLGSFNVEDVAIIIALGQYEPASRSPFGFASVAGNNSD